VDGTRCSAGAMRRIASAWDMKLEKTGAATSLA
jgi:hypothetical protein